MMLRSISFCMAVLASIAAVRTGQACTTFFVANGPERLLGKSYDWDMGQALVVFNKANVKKTSLLFSPNLRAVFWVSKYASLTFNQYGWEFPNGGMNEAGLAVEVMVSETQYPPIDQRPSLNELQWIQYQLDNFATVAELAANAPLINIVPIRGGVHYLTCDRSQSCAAIEYLDGRLVVHTGADMIARTLTNNTYAESVAYLKRYHGFGGTLPIPRSSGSLDRFVRASWMVSQAAGQVQDMTSYAFSVLDSVRAGSLTKWNIVYDLQRLRVHYRTAASTQIKVVDMDAFDRSCEEPALALNIETSARGNATGLFRTIRLEDNLGLVGESVRPYEDRYPGITERVGRFPTMFSCASGMGVVLQGAN